MLRFDIITIFPEFFRTLFDFGIVRRARGAGLVEINAHDLRDWTTDKQRMVDDRPFGGGGGAGGGRGGGGAGGMVAGGGGRQNVGGQRVVKGGLVGLSALHGPGRVQRAAGAGSFVERPPRRDRALAQARGAKETEAQPPR